MVVICKLGNLVFLACILLMPVLVDRIRDLDEPGPIFHQFGDFGRGKELDGIGRRIAQRLEDTGGDENRDVMNLAIQYPGRLLCVQPRGWLTQQGQKLESLLFHTGRKELGVQTRAPCGFFMPLGGPKPDWLMRFNMHLPPSSFDHWGQYFSLRIFRPVPTVISPPRSAGLNRCYCWCWICMPGMSNTFPSG